jgi:hypothetical protein
VQGDNRRQRFGFAQGAGVILKIKLVHVNIVRAQPFGQFIGQSSLAVVNAGAVNQQQIFGSGSASGISRSKHAFLNGGIDGGGNVQIAVRSRTMPSQFLSCSAKRRRHKHRSVFAFERDLVQLRRSGGFHLPQHHPATNPPDQQKRQQRQQRNQRSQ